VAGAAITAVLGRFVALMTAAGIAMLALLAGV